MHGSSTLAFLIREGITQSYLVKSKKITTNLRNPYFISATFRPCFFSPFSSFHDKKVRYKYYKNRFTTRDNSNVQCSDQGESTLHSTINTNNGALTITHDKIIKSPFSRNGVADILSKIEFKGLLSLSTKESDFIFNGKLYKQVAGVAMGSSLGSTLANNFLYTLKRIGYKIIDLTLSLVTTGGMLMVSFVDLTN